MNKSVHKVARKTKTKDPHGYAAQKKQKSDSSETLDVNLISVCFV
jgi:hypothetical protein